MSEWITRAGWILAAIAVSAGAAQAATVSGTAGSSDRVYTFIADTSQSARATLMWSKSRSDLDLYVFWLDAEEPELVAASFANGERFELTELGVLGDGLYSVVVSRFSGPSTRFTLNVTTTGSESVSFSASSDPAAGQLAPIGDLDSLASQEVHFAAMRQRLTRLRELKRSRR